MANSTDTPIRRLTESYPGFAIGIAMAAMWITAMSAVDSNACTVTPFLWGFIGIIIATVLCILRGYKVVRLPLTAWIGLGAGVYFLVRAMHGFSLTDNMTDCGLIFFAFVYYMAGLYSGQTNSSRGLAITISVALILNLLCLWLLRDPNISLKLIGRVDISLLGPNTRNTTLFAYKNFAGLFLVLGGGLLLWRCLWRGKYNISALLQILLAVGAIVGSCFCDTRVPYATLPLILIVGWLMWFILRLYSGRPLGIVMISIGMLLLVTILIALYDLFFGYTLLQYVTDIESHDRFSMWEWINSIAQQAPLYGYGPAGSTWQSLTSCNHYGLVNYAHNEYIQVWADYGLIGLGLMLLILILHIIAAFRGLAEESTSPERRVRISMALLCLLTLSLAAIVDYEWHSAALLSMGAFACGTLASPFPHKPLMLFSRRKHYGTIPTTLVRAENNFGKVFICAGGLALAAFMGKLSSELYQPWLAQWHYDAMVAQGADTEQRRDYLLQIIKIYPHHRIADHYINLAPTTHPDWKAYEQGLRTILSANPKQLIVGCMIAQTLTRQARYQDAEIAFRTYYPGDGPDNSRLNPWATFYSTNLLFWGQSELDKGNLGRAFSLLSYVNQIAKKSGYNPLVVKNSKLRLWTRATPHQDKFHQNCRKNLGLLKIINPTPDHSWKNPLTPEGKPALYSRYSQTPK